MQHLGIEVCVSGSKQLYVWDFSSVANCRGVFLCANLSHFKTGIN
jgi:hypothetical protein